MLKSLKTNTLADRLTERMLFIVNEIASNTVHRVRVVIKRVSRTLTVSKVNSKRQVIIIKFF